MTVCNLFITLCYVSSCHYILWSFIALSKINSGNMFTAIRNSKELYVVICLSVELDGDDVLIGEPNSLGFINHDKRFKIWWKR